MSDKRQDEPLYLVMVHLLVRAESPERAMHVAQGGLGEDCSPPGWLVAWGRVDLIGEARVIGHLSKTCVAH